MGRNVHSKFKSHWLHFHLLEYTTYFQLPFSHTLIKYFDHFSVLFSGCKILSPVECTRDTVKREASENNFSPGENRFESVGIRNQSQPGDGQTPTLWPIPTNYPRCLAFSSLFSYYSDLLIIRNLLQNFALSSNSRWLTRKQELLCCNDPTIPATRYSTKEARSQSWRCRLLRKEVVFDPPDIT